MLKDPKTRRIALIGGGVAIAARRSAAPSCSRMRSSACRSRRRADLPRNPRRRARTTLRLNRGRLAPANPPPGGENAWGIDIFFVHPTSAYSGAGWNAEDRQCGGARPAQGSHPAQPGRPFLQAGPVYAPLYRQAALHPPRSTLAAKAMVPSS